MGQKVHPFGFRLGVIRDWEAKWYADKDYTRLLGEDLEIRALIHRRLANAGVSKVEIERSLNEVRVTIHTAKPGIVIGKGGSAVEDLRQQLERLTGKKVRANIMEIRQPELDATLVARNVAEQLERRVAFRRATKQAVQRTMRMGAHGIRVQIAGRLGGAEMARRVKEVEGKVPLQTLRADIDYGTAEAATTYGRIGVKVWINRGEVLPGSAGDGRERRPIRERGRERPRSTPRDVAGPRAPREAAAARH